MAKRASYQAQFKGRVALEALKESKTLADLQGNCTKNFLIFALKMDLLEKTQFLATQPTFQP